MKNDYSTPVGRKRTPFETPARRAARAASQSRTGKDRQPAPVGRMKARRKAQGNINKGARR